MKNKEKIEVQYYDSVCGELILGAFGEAICLCDWVDKKHRTYIDNRLQSRLAATYCEKQTPIHRVIGSNGRLVGYSGGLDKKETLLQLEQGVDEV